MKLSFILESSIDYPQPSLSTTVWDISKDPEKPTLKPENKDKIIHLIKKYPEFDLMNIVKEIRIVGSICSNQYLSNTDVDVHLIVDDDKLTEIVDKHSKFETKEDVVKDVIYFSRHDEPPEDGMIGKHPFELYIQLDPNQDLASDGLYKVLENEWVIGPRIEKYDYDPYEYYSHLFAEIKKLSSDFDLELGSLKRDVIDYNVIHKALEQIPAESKKKIKKRLDIKLDEIEADIRKLMLMKKEIVDKRHNTNKKSQDDKVYDKVNSVFKFLDRYEYLKIIKDLEGMMEDEKIDDDEIEKIGELV